MSDKSQTDEQLSNRSLPQAVNSLWETIKNIIKDTHILKHTSRIYMWALKHKNSSFGEFMLTVICLSYEGNKYLILT